MVSIKHERRVIVPFILLLLLSGSIVVYEGWITILLICAASFIIMHCNIKVHNEQIKRACVLEIGCLLFFFVNYIYTSSFGFNHDSMNAYLRFYLFISLSIFICLIIESEKYDMEKILYMSLKFFIIHSLIGFVFTNLFDGETLILVNKANQTYPCERVFLLFFKKAMTEIGGIVVWRNQGLFWEPGILSIYANMFLCLVLFNKSNKNKSDILLALACILSTVSTTGMGVATIIIFAYVNRHKNMSMFNKICLAMLIVVCLSASIYSLQMKVESSMTKKGLGSYGLRVMDFILPLKLAQNNLLMGIGMGATGYTNEIYKMHSYSVITQGYVYTRGSSNGIMTLLYQLGGPFLFFYLWGLFNQKIIFKNNRLFSIIIFICLLSEPLQEKPFFLLFPLSGFIGLKSREG